MALNQPMLTALANGPRTRPALECAAIEAGYAPAGVVGALWRLKKAGAVEHVQRAAPGRQSLYRRTGDG